MNFINNEIDLLKEIDDVNEYYLVIQSKNLIYIINHSSIEGLDLYYEELGCYKRDNDKVIFLKRFDSKNETLTFLDFDKENCNLSYEILAHGESPDNKYLLGSIYKVKNNGFQFVKRGNIYKDNRKDKIFWFRKFRMKEPKSEPRINNNLE